MTASFTDIAAFSQDSIDSLVKANSAATKGFETLAKHYVDLASKSFEDAVAAGKKISAAKTPTEFLQIQTKLVQDSFETFVDESKKISEMTSAIFKEISAPLTAQFKTAVATAPKAAATAMKKAA
jgi:phasin family protein